MLHIKQISSRISEMPGERAHVGNDGPPEHGFIILYIVHGEQLVDLQRTCQVSVASNGCWASEPKFLVQMVAEKLALMPGFLVMVL